jgi:ATP-dependent DNA helicase RecQ
MCPPENPAARPASSARPERVDGRGRGSTGSTRADDERLLRDALHGVWGFSDFRPWQREAMHAILAGRDSVVVLPTGGGKSLCFQAPAVAADRGLALVVSPLISLMKDQVDGLRADGVSAAYLNSTLQPQERDDVLAAVRGDRLRLLYVSPERIIGEGSQPLRRLLQQVRVRFIAIDEAHCISQWGHDFRPEYRQLGRLRDDFPDVSVHAFTATATERVRRDVASELRLRDPIVLVGSFDRPNLTYRVLRRGTFQRQLIDVIARHEREAGIVYCLSRRETESVADSLREQGHRAIPYHAGLADEI